MAFKRIARGWFTWGRREQRTAARRHYQHERFSEETETVVLWTDRSRKVCVCRFPFDS